MIKDTIGGFTIIFEDESRENIIGYEGGDAVLDLLKYDNLKTIQRKAFLSCKILRKVYIPGSVVCVEEWAFSKCSNLQSFMVDGLFHPGIFGKGAFDGCESLQEIGFSDSDEGFKHLLSLTVNKMANDYLLRSDDLDRDTWYDKFDICLSSVLKADSSHMEADFATGGEEDLPFVGVGMVDGEMPDEGVDFFRGIEKNKCFLAYLRLKYNKYLGSDMESFLREFIKDRAFGKTQPYAFATLNEECGGDIDMYKIYMEVVNPDKETINLMEKSLNPSLIQAKAYLIECASKDDGNDFFDDLMI